ncbi:MAG TPA: SBBP repeat-containing protein [Stenomitos sp.]
MTVLQLPVAADVTRNASTPTSKVAPLLGAERMRNGGEPKLKLGGGVSWITKYQIEPGGIRKVLWKKRITAGPATVSSGVATDSSGNVLVAGRADDAVGGSRQSFTHAFVSKYSPGGILSWTKQLSSASYDYASNVATDKRGNVLISGFTMGSLKGPNKGGIDAWVAKYNAAGSLLWIRQLGTASDEVSRDVGVDSAGNVLITGYTLGALKGTNLGGSDAWAAKYSPSGKLLWLRQWGTTTNDESSGLATDSNDNLYILGQILRVPRGPLPGDYDVFLTKYSPTGTRLWTQELDSSADDESARIAIDHKGNVVISGWTNGVLGGSSKGGYDAFSAKYSPTGTQLWVKQLGSVENDGCTAITTDNNDNIFTAGWTDGALAGPSYGGYSDAWVAQFSQFGKQLWVHQEGTTGEDRFTGVATDTLNHVFLTGHTWGR